MISTIVTNAAIRIARADPSGIWAWRKKFTTRFAMRLPWAPPTSVGVRNSPRIGMNTKMQAVMIPARIWGNRTWRNAWSGRAPRSWAALSWVKSNFSSAA
jgi:hypothetical protein